MKLKLSEQYTNPDTSIRMSIQSWIKEDAVTLLRCMEKGKVELHLTAHQSLMTSLEKNHFEVYKEYQIRKARIHANKKALEYKRMTSK